MTEKTDQWGSRLGVILAVSGSAVGLGNFLRFPGQAAANGGGAFLIPYFAALIFLGIPICWAEWAMGRYGGQKGFHSAPAIMGVIGKGRIARYAGVMGVLIPLAVSFYYTFIAAWCLGYFWAYVTGSFGIDPTMAITDQTAASAAFTLLLIAISGRVAIMSPPTSLSPIIARLIPVPAAAIAVAIARRAPALKRIRLALRC